MKKLLLVVFLSLAASSAVGQSRSSDRPSAPMNAILWDLGIPMEDMRHRAAQAKSWEPVAAEAKSVVAVAAQKIDRYLKETGRTGEILDSGQDGVSPLTLAVGAGFADIVEVFLAYPEVRARLNGPIKIFTRTTRLWSIASAAPIHSVGWCGGSYELGVFLSPMSLPYLEAHPDQTPYLRVRTLLEQAGATPQPDEARTVWRFLCRVQTRPDQAKQDGVLLWTDDDSGTFMPPTIPGARDRVLAAPDMLGAIQQELMTLQKMRAAGKAPVTP